MGRPVMIACSLSIISAWGCSAVLPVENQTDASTKVVVDAEWSVDHPTEEMLAAVRGGERVDLPPNAKSRVARPRATAMGVVEHHSDAASSLDASQLSKELPSRLSPEALGRATQSKSPGHATQANALGRATQTALPPKSSVARLGATSVARPRATAIGVEDDFDAPSSLTASQLSEELSPRPSPEALGRATQTALPAAPNSERIQPSARSADRLEAQDLRLKAVARVARGEAIAQLQLPDGSIVFLREGQRLRLASAETPADVVIERIDDTQVQFQLNGSPQVLTLR